MRNDDLAKRYTAALAALENMRNERDALKRMVDMLQPGVENAVRAGQTEIERVAKERDEARERVVELEGILRVKQEFVNGDAAYTTVR